MKEVKEQSSGFCIAQAEALRERKAAWERYARWARHRQTTLPPSEAVASVGFLYELLPPESRCRSLEYEGVRLMHRYLAVLESR